MDKKSKERRSKSVTLDDRAILTRGNFRRNTSYSDFYTDSGADDSLRKNAYGSVKKNEKIKQGVPLTNKGAKGSNNKRGYVRKATRYNKQGDQVLSTVRAPRDLVPTSPDPRPGKHRKSKEAGSRNAKQSSSTSSSSFGESESFQPSLTSMATIHHKNKRGQQNKDRILRGREHSGDDIVIGSGFSAKRRTADDDAKMRMETQKHQRYRQQQQMMSSNAREKKKKKNSNAGKKHNSSEVRTSRLSADLLEQLNNERGITEDLYDTTLLFDNV